MTDQKKYSLWHWWLSLFAKKPQAVAPVARIIEESPRALTLEEAKDLICMCFLVSKPDILAAAKEYGFTSVAEISDHLKAGSNCGACHPQIEELLNGNCQESSETTS